jgi:ATP-dependent exoDNAse (exonuclease V) alpha subunit
MAAIQVSGITCDRLFCFSRDTYKILDESTLHRNMTEAGPIIAIDEASMVDAHMARLFGMITMRYRKKLLLIGDFAQAAPVNGDWAVSTKLFTDAHRIHLTEVHRQADPEFVAALQCMRHGVVNDTVWNALRSCRVQNPPMDDTWVRMFATNDMADRLNQERLHAITSAHEQQVLISRCEPMSARFEDPVIQQKACMDSQFAHGMTLAPRARVLVTINDYESQAVNGDAGTVIRIDASPKGETMGVLVDLDRKGRTYFEPRERYILSGAGNRLAKISGIPLRLGWALTIHRSQGLTLDKAYADLSSIYRFPEDRRHGMAYVACSRARSRDGLQIKGLSPQVVQCDPAIKAWI